MLANAPREPISHTASPENFKRALFQNPDFEHLTVFIEMAAHVTAPAESADSPASQKGARRFFDPARFLPAATPRMLAFFRITVCSILFASVCWEDLPSVVH